MLFEMGGIWTSLWGRYEGSKNAKLVHPNVFSQGGRRPKKTQQDMALIGERAVEAMAGVATLASNYGKPEKRVNIPQEEVDRCTIRLANVIGDAHTMAEEKLELDNILYGAGAPSEVSTTESKVSAKPVLFLTK